MPLSVFDQAAQTEIGGFSAASVVPSASPAIGNAAWGFAPGAYFDNPLPPRFKERLFIHLCRYGDAPYQALRYLATAMAERRQAMDAPAVAAEEAIELLQRPAPSPQQLDDAVGHLRSGAVGEGWRIAGSREETAVFACAAAAFAAPGQEGQLWQALRSGLDQAMFAALCAFLTFVRAAHFFATTQGDGQGDVRPALGHREAAGAILADPECLRHTLEAGLEEPTGRSDANSVDTAVQKLAAIVESSDDAILAKDLDGIIMSWNQGAERLFGYTAEEVIGKPVTILIPEDRQDEEPAILARIRRGERIDHYETIRQRKDGRLIDISLAVSPVRNRQGRVIGASKIARDITERRRAQEQQELLLREMDHRVKNLFVLAGGVVRLSARSAKTPSELASAVEARLLALSRAHALTLRSVSDAPGQTEQAIGMHDLIRTVLAPYDDQAGPRETCVTIDGPDIAIAGGTVTSFALLLHEFATNAAKYGALSVPEGRIEVTCSEAADQFVLTWKEHGGPRVADRTEDEGFGSLLIRLTVEGQLGGAISRWWEEAGLTIRLSVNRQRIAKHSTS